MDLKLECTKGVKSFKQQTISNFFKSDDKAKQPPEIEMNDLAVPVLVLEDVRSTPEFQKEFRDAEQRLSSKGEPNVSEPSPSKKRPCQSQSSPQTPKRSKPKQDKGKKKRRAHKRKIEFSEEPVLEVSESFLFLCLLTPKISVLQCVS